VACHQNPEHACAANADDAKAIAEREISKPLTQARLAAQKVREIG
jgi:hypothetical protein